MWPVHLGTDILKLNLAGVLLTCPRAGKLEGLLGALWAVCVGACICMSASRATAGAGTEGEEVLIMFADPVERT